MSEQLGKSLRGAQSGRGQVGRMCKYTESSAYLYEIRSKAGAWHCRSLAAVATKIFANDARCEEIV